MELRVLGWHYRNLRGGLRDLTIDLETKPCRWALIQMPNGLGKTTTMSLLRATFSGEVLSPETVRELRAADDVDEGSFEVRLAIDGKPYRILLWLDFKDGAHGYRTSRSEVRSGGLEEGRALPSNLKKLLTPDFTRLFVFDGELAKEIRMVGKDRAETAIRTLYGLDRLDQVAIQIARLVEEKQRKAAAISAASERKGVTRWGRAYKVAAAREAELTKQLRALRKSRSDAEARLAAIKKEIDSKIEQDGSLKARKDRLNAERIEVDRSIYEATTTALVVLRAPARLHPSISLRLRALGERLTTLKLPKTISSEFFRELAEQPTCVCGRAVTPEIRITILARAENYLAEDQVLVINKMKLALRESDADADGFVTAATALKVFVRALNANKAAQDQLELERIESGDSELERLRKEVSALEAKIGIDGEKAELLSTRDHFRQRALNASDMNNIPLCAAEAKRCKEKHATATDTLTFVTQAERLTAIVSAVSASAMEKLRERVRVSTNAKLELLVPSEPLRISKIEGSLELESRGLARKGNVSEGQSLSVAYAFLTSLLSEAPCKLPFIVDSPAVSLDTAVRREVGELIPGLFEQMIMFVISSEREGFADAFYDKKHVRYLTLSRKADGTTEVREGVRPFRTFHQSEVAS